ncbi:bifunctional helix-turn-helix transcriptional regulator/GNAT family N-acetyltransferase [Sinanaerobacter chloroacetimidivorans]|uniref:MarR family transcriptional regulator n=1 Tax=Sinanaerobacter chloroacetimidivorans TaxID=2818044 RepID=A0A8J7W2R6_9FIRM|nr:helix-turn-helix domain-containing GNAT family N-acetyltransferase [Sinanaerobacter chloroacetimidivorans]MBR0599389.1 MarR family transcriptional regulator [Sinanaerobacter chloroacetimidivorans]
MDSSYKPYIRAIRKFNRFYTNILGLLDQHMLDSEFSLSEVRVLYEIGHMENCTAKKLIEELRIDSGYLSRMLKRFEKQNLTYRRQSGEDGRLYYLYLTGEGKETLSKLDEGSDKQIYQMIDRLPEQNQRKLVEGMEAVKSALTDNPSDSDEDPIHIRYHLRPGDIGYLIYLHGWIYAEECGYNHVFEGYVCKTFYEFLENYNPEKDRIWIAEANNRIIGAIAIVGHSEMRAQLRWFILHPEYRGINLGGKLLQEALNYSKDKGYREIFLETTEDQKTAIHMYRKAGFRKIGEHENRTWGVHHVEQTYELITDSQDRTG